MSSSFLKLFKDNVSGFSRLTIITAWKLFLVCSINLLCHDVSPVALSSGRQCSVPLCQTFSKICLLPLVSSFVLVLVFLICLECSYYCLMGFHQKCSIPFWRSPNKYWCLSIAAKACYSTTLLTQQIQPCTMFVFPQHSNTTFELHCSQTTQNSAESGMALWHCPACYFHLKIVLDPSPCPMPSSVHPQLLEQVANYHRPLSWE